MRRNARIVVGLALLTLAGIGVAIPTLAAPAWRIGPSMRLLGNGRHLTPPGPNAEPGG